MISGRNISQLMRLIILLILETKFGDDPKVKSPIISETKVGCC